MQGSTMINFSKLKKWLTIEETAKSLSMDFDDDVSIGDVYQVCLEGHLQLSIRFSAPETAIKYKYICNIDDVESHKKQLIDSQTVMLRLSLDKQIGTKQYPYVHELFAEYEKALGKEDEETAFELFLSKLPVCEFTSSALFLPNGKVYARDEECRVGGIFKLAMYGNEKLDIDFLLCQEKGMETPDLIDIDGFFALDEKGDLYSVQATRYKENESGISMPWHYPSGGINDFQAANFVCSQDDLIDFRKYIQGLNHRDSNPENSSTRNSMLIIIAGLCSKAGIDPKKRGVSSEIVREIEALGVSIDSETVKKYLDGLPDLIARKQKTAI